MPGQIADVYMPHRIRLTAVHIGVEDPSVNPRFDPFESASNQQRNTFVTPHPEIHCPSPLHAPSPRSRTADHWAYIYIPRQQSWLYSRFSTQCGYSQTKLELSVLSNQQHVVFETGISCWDPCFLFSLHVRCLGWKAVVYIRYREVVYACSPIRPVPFLPFSLPETKQIAKSGKPSRLYPIYHTSLITAAASEYLGPDKLGRAPITRRRKFHIKLS